MLANTNYALSEKLQLGHMLKPFAAVSPCVTVTIGPVEDHHQYVSTSLCVWVPAPLTWRRVGSGGLASVFSSLLIRINEGAFISVKDVKR